MFAMICLAAERQGGFCVELVIFTLCRIRVLTANMLKRIGTAEFSIFIWIKSVVSWSALEVFRLGYLGCTHLELLCHAGAYPYRPTWWAQVAPITKYGRVSFVTGVNNIN